MGKHEQHLERMCDELDEANALLDNDEFVRGTFKGVNAIRKSVTEVAKDPIGFAWECITDW